MTSHALSRLTGRKLPPHLYLAESPLSPEVVRRHSFRTGSSGGLLGAFLGDSLSELRRSGKLGLGVVRDSLFSWNRDWKEV